MATEKCYAAVDIGASSGRVYAGWLEDGKMQLEEAYRFVNGQKRLGGHDCWDVEALFDHVAEGLAACKTKLGVTPATIGIDTWGVDYVLVDKDGQLVGDAVAYRDDRTYGMPEAVDHIIAPEELYARTGIQRNAINTIYQLMAHRLEHPEQLEEAERLLLIPDYLNWRLTDVAANEYTNASTTGLLDARTCDWDWSLLDRLHVPCHLFERPLMPGHVLGKLTPEMAERIGYQADVVLVASHDTGSAFVAVPADDESVFISSGTWSLVGAELANPITSRESMAYNFTNEGGCANTYRYLANIMGLWMNQSVRREYNGVDYVEGKTSHMAKSDHEIGFGEMVDAARAASGFTAYVDVADDRFLAPESMIEEIRQACLESGQDVPQNLGEVMRVIYVSLARAYAKTVDGLRELTGKHFTNIHIVGGGCQDTYLDELTAKACGLPVYAGPIEGTCLGNLAVQMIAAGELADVAAARACIAQSFPIERYEA